MKKTIAIVAYETNPAVCSSMMMHVDMMADAGYNIVMFVQRKIDLYVFSSYSYPQVVFDKPREIKKLFIDYHINMIWCTNVMYVIRLVWLTRLPIILWNQGEGAAESFMKHHSYIRKCILELINAYALHKVTGIVYVSESMKAYYENKYRLHTKSIVVPCLSEFADSNNSVEKIPNSFVYIGGLSVWQCFDEILKIYAKIRTAESIFHIITLDTITARKKVLQVIGDDMNIEIYGIKNRAQIPDILSRFQYGFLIRKQDVVNMVAAPIKFLEYLSCGVNVIMTDAVPSYAKIVREKKVGTVINLNDDNICLNYYNPSAKDVYKELFDRKSFVNEYNNLLK